VFEPTGNAAACWPAAPATAAGPGARPRSWPPSPAHATASTPAGHRRRPADPRSVYAVVPTFSYPDGPGGSFRGTVVVARSRNGGRSWQPPRSVWAAGAGWLTTGHQLVVLPEGTLLDVFVLLDLRSDPQRPALQVGVLRSGDRGGGWSPLTVIAELRSVGVTDLEGGDPVAGGTRFRPAVAVDSASGRVLVAWQDARFSQGQADVIALAFSADAGVTRSAPEKASATPTDVPAPDQQAFAPNLVVACDGTVGVSYFDVRHNDAGAALWTDRWLVGCHPAATSACPGPGAPAEARLTPTSFDMRQAHLLTSVGPPGCFLGDYQGLTSTGRGFLAVFAQPHDDDPASVFAAR
jgi:hypothetical protein